MVGLCGVTLLIALVPLFAILYSLSKRASTGGASTFSPSPQFPSLIDPNDIGGISNAIIGSLVIDGIAAAFAIPIGVIAGLFLAESDSKFAGASRTTAEIMTGLPSTCLGIFAYQMIVIGFDEWGIKLPGIGFSGIVGSFAIGVLMIPVIMKASETALRAVPSTIREAGLALGGVSGVVARKVVIPTALPGRSPPCCWRSRGPSARPPHPVGDPRFQPSCSGTRRGKWLRCRLPSSKSATSPYVALREAAWGIALALVCVVPL